MDQVTKVLKIAQKQRSGNRFLHNFPHLRLGGRLEHNAGIERMDDRLVAMREIAGIDAEILDVFQQCRRVRLGPPARLTHVHGADALRECAADLLVNLMVFMRIVSE